MSFRQKLCNFLATKSDYEGFHYIADSYRKGNTGTVWILFDLLGLVFFPLSVLLTRIVTGRFHSPNCDCKKMKDINKKR